MKNLTKLAAIAALVLGFGASQAAAEFPDRQITMIVPFGAGGGSDRVARTVDQFWQEKTGESFNFQYQPGASGAVGTAAIARAEADGYTVGIVNMPNLVVQPISGSATFALDDFDYIGGVNYDPMVLMVPEQSPFNSLEEFIAAAKEAPGTFTVAITGSLSVGHIGALELMEGAGIDVTLVPTQGGANTVARVAGGHVTAGIIGLGLFTTQESGRALGITSKERSEFAPDIPTFAEKGIYPLMQPFKGLFSRRRACLKRRKRICVTTYGLSPKAVASSKLLLSRGSGRNGSPVTNCARQFFRCRTR